MRFALVALVLGLALLASSPRARAAAPAAPAPHVRLAITEFLVDGGGSPALAKQLEEGFVAGLERGGLQVLAGAEMTKRFEPHPELQHCDASACFKAAGQLLDVKYLVNVKVDVAGNTYKTIARVFSTEGTAPAALPVATKQKTCDVCTVDEARETLVRLADMLRPNLEEAPPPPPPPVARTVPSPSVAGPVVAALAGAVAVATGLAVWSSNGTCTGISCGENRTRTAVGGVLVGAGAAFAVMGTYVTVVRMRGSEPVTGVSLAFNF
ncbi:MAG TPA: hypothetical protein VHJ20_22175 [Polyangia bacterium]|nr:hypothetical protein [Polyangia bacterium]